MAKKRVYKYGQCYKCPKCFKTYEIVDAEVHWTIYGECVLDIMDVVTREVISVPFPSLDTYEREYTYCD